MVGEDGILFSLDTDAPINEFNTINGQIQWKIDPNEIKMLEKTFSFILKVYKKNNPEKFDVDTFKIIYSEKNYAPVFGKTSKWVVEEGKYHEYKIPVEDPNVNDSFVIDNVGAQFPRDMILDSKNNMKVSLKFDATIFRTSTVSLSVGNVWILYKLFLIYMV